MRIAFGVYAFKGGESATDAIAAADKAMYAQKRATQGEARRAAV